MKIRHYSVVFSDDAENDFQESYEYYNDDNSNVADLFFRQINASLDLIKSNPFLFLILQNNIRKFTVKKFPFLIYFQVEDDVIKVIAIFHTSRSPEVWKDRIQ